MRKLLLILIISLFLFARPATCLAASSLRVSVFPKEIDQLGKYVISATNPDGSPFAGTLQTQYWLCPLEANSHTDLGCSAKPSNSFVIPSSGKAVQDLAFYPNNYGPAIETGKYFVQWKPASGAFDWSNETVLTVTPLDMKRYFNLTDGNFYRYNANNLRMNQIINDATRLDIKNETYCENTNSLFFSKTSKYAYWNPSYGTNDNGDLTTSDFMVWRPKWNEKGELETKTWSNYHQSFLPTSLDSYPVDGFTYEKFVSSNHQFGIKADSTDPLTPYVYSINPLNLNTYGGPDPNWYVTDEVRFVTDTKQTAGATNEADYKTKFCAETIDQALTAHFRTMPIMKYYAKIIDTPAYKGPVAVVNIREVPKQSLGDSNISNSNISYINCKSIADFPSNCPEVLREDWFMAKDIGLVRIDIKNFGGIFNTPPSPSCADDPDCQKNGIMNNPDLIEQLTSYHVNYPPEKYLTIDNETPNSRTFNIRLNRNDFSDLNFLDTLNQIQLVIDDDANWDNGYGVHVMVNMRDNGSWKSGNQVNGVYYVYEKELGISAPFYGWQTVPIASTYTSTTFGFNVSLVGLLYDGKDLNISINENDGVKGFSLANKNIYLYLEGQNGVHGTIPLFAKGQETYQGYTFAKIGQFIPSIPPSTPTIKPGDLNNDQKVDIFDLRHFLANFLKIFTIFDYNKLVENFGR